MKTLFSKLTRASVIAMMALLAYSCQQEEAVEEEILTQESTENYVDLDEATSIAYNLQFPKLDDKELISGRTEDVQFVSKEIDRVMEVPGRSGQSSYYIFNYEGGGFVIISGDRRAEPIKAYSFSENFSFDAEEYPSALVAWLSDTNQEIEDIRDAKFGRVESNTMWLEPCAIQRNISGRLVPIDDGCGGGGGCQDTHVSYGPLLTTEWGQWAGYNNFAGTAGSCPGNPNNRPPSGCVATAMAQVMNYYEEPAGYNWANMPDNNGNNDVSTLMRDVADAVNMNWGCNGSGADTQGETASSFVNDFGYSSATYAGYNVSTVKSQIRFNRPVILRGGDKDRNCFLIFCSNTYVNGHAWVCDGYRSSTYCETGTTYTYLHMNWGWSGNFDGYFAYNNWNPGGNSFNYKQGMVYNIRP